MNRDDLRQKRQITKPNKKENQFIGINHIFLLQTIFSVLIFSLFFFSKQLNIQPVLAVYQQMESLSSKQVTLESIAHIKSVISQQWKEQFSEEANGKGGFFALNPQELSFNKVPKNHTFSPGYLSIALSNPLDQIKVTSSYGFRKHPILDTMDFHTGVDLAAPMGTPIKSPAPGVVKEVGTDKIYGNYVIISHGANSETFYGHNETILVKQGDQLKRGDQVATIGSTGLSTGPHLHFETRIDGITVDPSYFIKIR